MKNAHLSEEMLQAFLWDKSTLTPSDAAHMETCTACLASAANYRLLFNKLEQIPGPTFDFNVAAAVMHQLDLQHEAASESLTGYQAEQAGGTFEIHQPGPVPTTGKVSVELILCLSFFVLLIGVPVYFFREYFKNIITGVSSLLIYMIIVSILLISGFLGFDQYQKFNQRIRILDV